jgi:hypothetical protein
LSDKRFEHENNCPKGYISDRTEFSRLAIEADVLFDTLRTIKEYLQGEERYQDLIRYWELELEVRTAELRRKAYYYVVFNPDIEFYPEED